MKRKNIATKSFVFLILALLGVAPTRLSAQITPDDEVGYFAYAAEKEALTSQKPELFLNASELKNTTLEMKEPVYYAYLRPSGYPAFAVDERLRETFLKWEKAVWAEREARAASGEAFHLGVAVCRKDASWLSPDLWRKINISGLTIVAESTRDFQENARGLDATYGIPVTLSSLIPTYSWQERRVAFFSLSAPSLADFSFADWQIMNSSIVSPDPANCDFSNTRLTNVLLEGPFKFSQLAKTDNFKDKDFRFVRLKMGGAAVPKDWSIESWSHYDPEKGTIDVSERPTRAISFTDLTPSDFIHKGVKKEAFYSSLGYQSGLMANYYFYPEGENEDETELFDASGWDLSRLDLTNAKLRRLNLKDADFTNSVISYCSFEGSQGLTLEQLKTTWNWRRNRMNTVVLPEEIREEVQKALEEEYEEPGSGKTQRAQRPKAS